MKKYIFPICVCFVISVLLIVLLDYNGQINNITKEAGTSISIPSDIVKSSVLDSTDTHALTQTTVTNTSYPKGLNAPNLTSKDALAKLASGTIIDVSKNKKDIVKAAFYYEKISKDIKLRMKDKSYKKDCTVPYEDLRYVRVLYYGFDKKTHIGELVVNKQIAKDVTAIFKELYLAKYPIEKMVLIDDYNANDEASMADNNTTAFNFRTMTGSKNLSKHALGLAIDINPLYNPYVKTSGTKTIVSPENGYKYKNRKLNNTYYIKKDDICYHAFIKRGFTWGGAWKSIKDYQHFEKSIK